MVQRNIVIAIIILVLFVVLAAVGFGMWWMYRDISDYTRGGSVTDSSSSA